MQSLPGSVCLGMLLFLGAGSILPLSADDVTLTGVSTFASIDGSAQDHDGLANGVFTVDDGNLVIDGTISCDDPATPGQASACAMRFVVSGDLTIEAGGVLSAENRVGKGNGGNITLEVGGSLFLRGATPGLPGALVSSSRFPGTDGTAGNLTFTAGGDVALEKGSILDAGTHGGTGGAISITAGGAIDVNGLVAAGSSRTVLASRLTGKVLDGGNSNQKGGAISLRSTSLRVEADGIVVSQGEKPGAGTVLLEACGIEVRGLVASVSVVNGPTQVLVRSGAGILIDGRDLGAADPLLVRRGRIRNNAIRSSGPGNGADLLARGAIEVHGPEAPATLFAVTSRLGASSTSLSGGLIRAYSLDATLTASGNAFETGRPESGNRGGVIDLRSSGDALLDGATVRAMGGGQGGMIAVRSYQGDVSWTFGVGDVRRVGTGAPASAQGSIQLTACGTVDVTGTSFPTNGSPILPFPVIAEGVCSPAAPSLPAGQTPLPICNEPPTADDQSVTTQEDTPVDITLTGSDPDGDPLTFMVLDGPDHGELTGTAPDLTYTPDPDFEGSDSFTFKVNDGTTDSAPATVSITVEGINDAPSFTKGDDQTVNEDAGPQTVDPWATAISPGPNESGQNVTFHVTGNTNPGLFAAGPAVSPTGVLTYTPAPDAFGTATITLVLQDDGGTANGGVDTSAPQTFVITVNAVNDAPSFIKGPDQTVNEDAGPQTVNPWATAISVGPANESGQTVAFLITGNSNPGLFAAGPAVSPTGVLTYTPAPNVSGTATIALVLQDNGGTANGGVDTSAPQTFVITVNAVNDAPSFVKGPDVTVNEDAGPQTFDPWATAISPGPGEPGQTVTFNVTGNTNPALFSAGPAVSPTGVLTFTPAPNAFGTATITLVLQDDGGTANGGVDTSAPQTFVITVNAVNDAPSFVKGPDVVVDEDSGPQTVNPWATAISPGPGEPGQTVTFNVTGNTNPGLFSAGPAVSPTGVLTFTSAPNAFGTATISLTLSDDGGTANGGIDTSAVQTFVITVLAVNDAPLLTDATPNYTAIGNTQLRVSEPEAPPAAVAFSTDPLEIRAAGKAGPITDVEGDTITVVPASGPTTAGGTFEIEADGDFHYHPPANFNGTDTFVIQITDDGSPAATVSATVTIAVAEMVWYVKNDTDTAGIEGTSLDPVDTLAEAESLSGANHYIYVFKGDESDEGQDAGITLKNGQKLLGQGVDLVVASHTLVSGGLANRPLVTNAAGNAVTVLANTANGNRTGIEIRGLRLASTGAGANAIDLTAADAAALEAVVAHNEITGATAEGIDINAGSTGAHQIFSIHDNTVTAGLRGIDVNRTAGTATVTHFARNVIKGATGGSGIEVVGVTFDSTPGLPINQVLGDTLAIGESVNGVGINGLVLTGVTGDLSFDQVNIFNDAGAGLRASSTGALNAGAGTGFRFIVNAAGPGSTIDSNGGPAVDVSGASLNLPLSILESTNSITTGVSLVNAFGGAGSTTLSAGSGLISDPVGASGTAFNVSGGTGNISFPGQITNSAGNAVVVTGRTGDTVSFTGAVSDTGSGISLTGNGGATISFTGGVTASTGINPAFAATGGGTVRVTGSANTLTTTTGTALNIANTMIDASGLNFRSISAGTAASGPVNGIVLNNTGASGGLTVAGTGGAGTGGTIQRTSGDSILLTNTWSVSLSSMNVQNSLESGILGTSVNGLNLTGCNFTSNGDDSADVGVKVNNLFGSATFSNTSVTGSALANVFIDNTTGTLSSLTISGGSYSSLGTAFGGNSVLLNIRGTSVLTTGSVSGVTLSNNKPARAITVQAQDTASIGDFTVQTSTFTNNGVQASFEQSGSANLSFKLLNNPTMTMTLPAAGTSHAVNVASSSTSTGGTIEGTIQGNTIGNAATPSSGSPIGSGIRVFIQGRTQATLLIDNNVIRQVPQARGIDAQFLGPLSIQPLVQSDITVTNNDVDPQDSTGFPAAAIYLAADSQGGSPVRMRSDVRGNTVPAGAAVDSLPTFLIVDEVAAAAEAQLVDTAPANANCTAQLTSTNTGSASAAPGCALIAGPISTPL